MLEALAALEIPAFDYAQLIDDFYNFRTEHSPPSSPPVYEIGDRGNLCVISGTDEGNVQIDAELRGKTDNVLIWVDYPLAYSNWRAQRMAEPIDSEVIKPIHELFQYSAPPGIDGDPRLTIVLFHNEESSWQGIFDKGFASPHDLSKALLRFGLMTDGHTLDRGFAIDDLRIDGLDIHDGFEAPDDAWVAEGWLRTDNRLPQNTWLQVVQETDSGSHLDRYLVTGTQQVDIDAPSGNGIGLIPQGRAVDALDKSGDWFQVGFEGTLGWIHAGYVTTTGNCP
ncbi:MAG: SH3 domain-containing protein [Chloroflexi bacterium]|nr:SH3 domain-containing protein [Chloroflexota bacterium]